MATSVPAPIAMPTSARASAGESLTPSPTMATFRPRPCSSATFLSLSAGRTSANTSSMSSSAATACATCRASPVIMATLMPRCLQGRDGLAGLGPHGILEADRAQDRAAVHHVEHRRAAAPARRRWRRPSPAVPADAELPEQGRAAHLDRAAVDRGADAAAGQRREAVGRRESSSPRSRAAATIARASGMFAVRLHGGGEGQHASVRGLSPSGARRRSLSSGSPLVRVPVLSNSTTSTGPHALQRHPVLDQHARPGGPLGGDGDDERDGQAQGVRAGDHQHGHGAGDGVGDAAQQGPDR